VISTVYTSPLPAKLLFDPFPTVISEMSKPVTDSLKVNVTGIGLVCVVEEVVELIVTVGGEPASA